MKEAVSMHELLLLLISLREASSDLDASSSIIAAWEMWQQKVWQPACLTHTMSPDLGTAGRSGFEADLYIYQALYNEHPAWYQSLWGSSFAKQGDPGDAGAGYPGSCGNACFAWWWPLLIVPAVQIKKVSGAQGNNGAWGAKDRAESCEAAAAAATNLPPGYAHLRALPRDRGMLTRCPCTRHESDWHERNVGAAKAMCHHGCSGDLPAAPAQCSKSSDVKLWHLAKVMQSAFLRCLSLAVGMSLRCVQREGQTSPSLAMVQ